MYLVWILGLLLLVQSNVVTGDCGQYQGRMIAICNHTVGFIYGFDNSLYIIAKVNHFIHIGVRAKNESMSQLVVDYKIRSKNLKDLLGPLYHLEEFQQFISKTYLSSLSCYFDKLNLRHLYFSTWKGGFLAVQNHDLDVTSFMSAPRLRTSISSSQAGEYFQLPEDFGAIDSSYYDSTRKCWLINKSNEKGNLRAYTHGMLHNDRTKITLFYSSDEELEPLRCNGKEMRVIQLNTEDVNKTTFQVRGFELHEYLFVPALDERSNEPPPSAKPKDRKRTKKPKPKGSSSRKPQIWMEFFKIANIFGVKLPLLIFILIVLLLIIALALLIHRFILCFGRRVSRHLNKRKPPASILKQRKAKHLKGMASTVQEKSTKQDKSTTRSKMSKTSKVSSKLSKSRSPSSTKQGGH